AGGSQLDVPHALAANLGKGHFNAAFVADHAAMFHAFVLTAQAFPVGDRAKNAGTKQAVTLRLEGAVIDGLRLGHFTMRPGPDLLRRRQADADGVKFTNQAYTIIRAAAEQGFLLQRREEILSRLHPRDAGAVCGAARARRIYTSYSAPTGASCSLGFLINSTSRQRLCNSRTRTLNDSGTPGSMAASPLTMASYILARPYTSSDLAVSSSCRI